MERQRDRMGAVLLNTYLVRVNLTWVVCSQQMDPFPPSPTPRLSCSPIGERDQPLLMYVPVFIWFGMQENLFLSVRKYCYCLSGKFASLCEKVLPVCQENLLLSVRKYCLSLSGRLFLSVRKYCLLLCLSGILSLWRSNACVCQENVLLSVRKYCPSVSKTCFSLWGSIAVCQEILLLSVRK